jgi:hypothetical protein
VSYLPADYVVDRRKLLTLVARLVAHVGARSSGGIKVRGVVASEDIKSMMGLEVKEKGSRVGGVAAILSEGDRGG